MMTDDMELLRDYAERNSDEAFSVLVSRHINLVYSVALRQVGDTHLAEEITQTVFIILARKASSLGAKTILSGWLCRTARYASANALTMQRRRQNREQEAHMQSVVNEPESDVWLKIAPLLDGALEHLGEKDHNAIVLRFFEGKDLKQVGAAMGTGEDAAKMRVHRALEKLRKFFVKRGVVSTTAIIAGVVSANSVQAAPIALAKTISTVAITKGAAASSATLILVKGTMKLMTWMKIKFALGFGTAILLTSGLVAVAVSGDKTQHTPKDLTAFFKQAISSPPDVEYFIAGVHPLGDPPIINGRKLVQKEYFAFFDGARAGTNFFLRGIANTNSPAMLHRGGSINGRAGSTHYYFTANSVSYMIGTNIMNRINASEFRTTRQFLNMGLAEIEPGSVVWSGSEFTAVNNNGEARYGVLEVLNNLPHTLTIRTEKDSPPLTTIEYTYPNPPNAGAGFPTRMVMTSQTKEGLKPSVEVVLHSVHLAPRPLTVDFFSEAQFKTAGIVATTRYSNEVVFVSGKDGKMYSISNMNGKTVAIPSSLVPK